jgi:polyphenol oxidase
MTFFPTDCQSISGAKGDAACVLSEVDRYCAVMAFSLRNGGCSPPPFGSLNFSVQQGDTWENVRRNVEVLGSRLGIDPARIATCRQVHGDDVAILDDVPRVRPQVDAMIATVPGVFPAIKTADCVPILLVDRVRRVSAAVHAGWRGTVKRITRKVVVLMKDRFKSRAEDIVAALGPAIRGCCYEVDDAVLVPFRESVPDGNRFIRRERKHESEGETRTLDLAAANRAELLREGIPSANIHELALCTCCSPELLFSHRRDGSPSGRHMSLVGFRE